MQHRAWLAAVLATMTAGSSSLAAEVPDNETAGDLRCLAVSLLMSRATDERVRSAGVGSSLYFMGRLDSHAPDTDLQNKLVETVEKMSAADLTAEARRCGPLVQGRGKALAAASDDMVKRAKNLQPKPGTPQTPAPTPDKPAPTPEKPAP